MDMAKRTVRCCVLLLLCMLTVLVGKGISGEHDVLIGLYTDPPATAAHTPAALRKWFKVSVDAGVTTVPIGSLWSQIEKIPGDYSFGSLEFQSQLASEFRLPIYLNIKIINTDNSGVPAAYAGWSFNDPRMAAKLEDLIRALAPHLHGEVKWVSIGNEVNVYLSQHPDQIAGYAKLMERIKPTLRQVFPGAQFTVNFTFSGLAGFQKQFKPIINTADFISLTYYPLGRDFVYRDPGVVRRDIQKMVKAAGRKKLFLQEVGYSSATRINGSEEKQAQFVRNVFAALREFQSHIIAADFLCMSDLPPAVVDHYAAYYRLHDENFKAYLGTLGYFNIEGKPKPAWKVFEDEARHMAKKH